MSSRGIFKLFPKNFLKQEIFKKEETCFSRFEETSLKFSMFWKVEFNFDPESRIKWEFSFVISIYFYIFIFKKKVN